MDCVWANWFDISVPVILGFAILSVAQRTTMDHEHSDFVSKASPIIWLIVGLSTLMVIVHDCT